MGLPVAISASEFQLLTLKSAMGLSTAISASEFQLRNLQSAMGLSTAVSASEFQIRKPEICIGSSNAASASEFQIRTLKSALGLHCRFRLTFAGFFLKFRFQKKKEEETSQWLELSGGRPDLVARQISGQSGAVELPLPPPSVAFQSVSLSVCRLSGAGRHLKPEICNLNLLLRMYTYITAWRSET